MKTAGNIISIEEVKKRLTPLFKDQGLQIALLFGSSVTGEVHKHSDIDLALLYDRPVDILILTNRVIRYLRNDNVDVVDLRRASPLLKYSILKKGRLLYEKSLGTFNTFYSLTFRRYIDTKKLRDAQAETIKYFLETRNLV
jgi:uncharacterized protein